MRVGRKAPAADAWYDGRAAPPRPRGGPPGLRVNDNYFLLAFAFLAISFLLGPLLRRAGQRKALANAELRRAEAAAKGVRYELATGEAAPGASPVAAAADPGTHVFSGASGGLPWTAQVEALLDHDQAGPRRVWKQRTRLTFAGVRAAPGTFVLAMALPPGVEVPPAPAAGAGFLAGLAAQAVEGILDLYVGGYFGPEHRALVNLAGSFREEGPPGFFLLATDRTLAARLLDAEGKVLLAGLREGAATPREQEALRGFGLLVSPDGLTFACQAAFQDAAELRGLAERVARLVARAR